MTIEDILRNPAKSLKGAQNEVFHMPPEGPVLVKGCAGSGKTLIAVARAEYLSRIRYDTFRPKEVAIFTYNKELSYRVRCAIPTKSIVVQNVDAWAYQFLCDHGYDLGQPGCWQEYDSKVRECLRRAYVSTAHGSTLPIFKRTVRFFEEEIQWIKGGFLEEEYRKEGFVRSGRGSNIRLTYQDRLGVLAVLQEYKRLLSKAGVWDREDQVIEALEIVRRENFRPYTHVVVDEAQDMTMSRLTLITQLVDEVTNSITIVADMAQQIYHSGFSWSRAGLVIKKGHSFIFTKNYRNTRQIAEAAASLMSHEEDRSEFTEMKAAGVDGPKPCAYVGEVKAVARKIWDILAAIPAGESIVVAAYGRDWVSVLREKLGEHYSVRICDGHSHRVGKCGVNQVDVCTFHSLKGLEYDHVVLWDISALTFPPLASSNSRATYFRKLLNVSMTRARKTLTILCRDEPSAFLKEIDSSKIEFRRV